MEIQKDVQKTRKVFKKHKKQRTFAKNNEINS